MKQMKKKRGGSRTGSLLKSIKSNWILYAMLIPAIVWYLIFCYAPMGGVTLAFKNYQYNCGIFGRPFIWISQIWKEAGWDAIIYMAALTSIDPQLYEAADIDGAGRWQKIRYVTWPGIRSVVCIMLILQVGGIMGGACFDKIFNLYSAPVYEVADIIDTYVYRLSFLTGSNFGYTTAVGLFKSVIGVILITVANKVVVKSGEEGLF